jgi:hypothetical protein
VGKLEKTREKLTQKLLDREIESQLRVPNDERLANILKGKRVIVVGPAGYLEGQGMGEYIDSFDIVVRMNKSVTDRNKRDYGTKTDILFTFATEMWQDYWHGKINILKNSNIRAIVLTTGIKKYITKMKKAYQPDVPVHLVSSRKYNSVRKQVACKPNTGTVAISYLLDYRIKYLEVVGVDLYASGYNSTYDGDGRVGKHIFTNQIFYLNWLAQKDKRLKLNDNLINAYKKLTTIIDKPKHIELPKISVLIPYKSDGGKIRDKVFEWNVERIMKIIPEAEICIGENKDNPFNRSAAKNDAESKATSDILCIIDADALFDRQLIEKAYIELVRHGKCVRIRGSSICLTENETNRLIKGDIMLSKQLETYELYSTNFFTLLKREQFRSIAGFDEKFKDWGGEDFAFYKTLKVYFGEHAWMHDQKIFHIWHPKNKQNKDKHMKAIRSKKLGICHTADGHIMYDNAVTIEDIERIRER